MTDDARLRALIGRISAGLPFRIGALLTKAEFATCKDMPEAVPRKAAKLRLLDGRLKPITGTGQSLARLRLDTNSAKKQSELLFAGKAPYPIVDFVRAIPFLKSHKL